MNKQIPIVIAIIRDDEGKVLIARRNDESIPDAHDRWEFIGGKIEFGEKPEEALIREVKEESGLEVEVVGLLPYVHTNIWQKGDEQHQVFLLSYECRIVGGSLHDTTFDPKIAELKFIDPVNHHMYDALPGDTEILASLARNA
jgi:mutator protein MutT